MASKINIISSIRAYRISNFGQLRTKSFDVKLFQCNSRHFCNRGTLVSSNHLSSNHVSSNHLSSNHLSSNHLASNHLSSNRFSSNRFSSNQKRNVSRSSSSLNETPPLEIDSSLMSQSRSRSKSRKESIRENIGISAEVPSRY